MKSSGSGALPAPPTLQEPVARMAPAREVSGAGICGREWGRTGIDHTMRRRDRAAGMTALSWRGAGSSDMDDTGGGGEEADGTGGGDGSSVGPAFCTFMATLCSLNKSFG